MDGTAFLAVLPGSPVALASYAITTVLVAILLALAFRTFSRIRTQVQLDRQLNRVSGQKLDTQETMELLNARSRDDALNDSLLRILPTLGRTRLRLRQAGLQRLDIKFYVMGLLALTAVLISTVTIPYIPSYAQPLVVALGLHLFIDIKVLGFIIQRRKNKILAQIADALGHMVRGIQVGQSPEAAIADAAEVVKAPLKEHLVLVKQLTDVGVPLVDALSAIAVDIDMPEFDFAVAAVSAQTESGGNLSSALMNLVDSIRARHQLQMKVQALSAEGKVSAAMMVMMPILLFIWLSMSRPDYVAPFYEDPTGEMLMFLAFGLLGIGAYVLSKIARIKV